MTVLSILFAVSLAGSYIASTLPFIEVGKLAGGWGGGTEEQWKRMQNLFKVKTLWGNGLLVVGTFLQILGAALSVLF